MHPLFAKASRLRETMVGAAIEVHRDKGPGCTGTICEWCLRREFEPVSCNTYNCAVCPHFPSASLRLASRYKVTLTQKERERPTGLTRSGKSTAAQFIHARPLQRCDAGKFGDPWKVADVAPA